METFEHITDKFDVNKSSKDYEINDKCTSIKLIREDDYKRRGIQGINCINSGHKYRIKVRLHEDNNIESDIDIGIGKIVSSFEEIDLKKDTTFLLDCSDG